MDIKVLRYYITVVETANISKAAKALYISQPPLSQAIKQLEIELGTPLFDRGHRNITLTSAGKLLYKRAKQIVNLTDDTVREIESISKGNNGYIKIGIISSFNYSVISRLLTEFNEIYPSISFRLLEQNTFNLIAALDNNDIEAAIIRTPFENLNNYNSTCLIQDSILAFGHKKFFNGVEKDEMLDAAFFKNKPLLMYRRWEPVLSKYFKQNKITPTYKAINDSAHLTISLAKSGYGISILPKSVALTNNFNNSDYECHPIERLDPISEIYIVTHPDHFVSPATQNFINAIIEAVNAEFESSKANK